jgi:hypothetical protein
MSDLFQIPDPDRHWGCRINDQITWYGMRALLIQNELLQIVVLVDKGSEIVQFLYKPLDVDFIWRAPNNPPLNPARYVPAGADQEYPFFDMWSGGWFEILPNGGPPCEYKGAELGFFAETTNVPWQYRILEDSPECVRVGLWVKTKRTPFLLQKTLTLKAHSPALFIEERVTNQGAETMDFMWGHHPVVAQPFLDESCRLSAPTSVVEVLHDEDGPDYRMGLHQKGTWPIIKDKDGGPLDLREIPAPAGATMDNCYLSEFTEGWVAVSNTSKQVGFGLAWNPDVFRYVWIWQALGGGIGYPWYGRTYNMGIEPWTSFPCAGLQEAIKRETALQLGPGESLDTWLTAVAYTGKDEVSFIGRDGEVK